MNDQLENRAAIFLKCAGGMIVSLAGVAILSYASWKGWIAHQWNDDAKWGYLMIAFGGALLIFNGIRFVRKAATGNGQESSEHAG